MWKVILESYYDDFADGGVYVIHEELFEYQSNAEKFFDLCKEWIKGKKPSGAKTYDMSNKYGFGSADEYYGCCAYIRETEMSDNVRFEIRNGDICVGECK